MAQDLTFGGLPHFPTNRGEVDDDAWAGRALTAIRSWQERWLAVLAGHESGLGDRLLAALRLAFDAPHPPAHPVIMPLGVLPLPATSAAPPATQLRRVLLWRADLMHFLADAWDTLGPSDYDMEECGRVVARLMPTGTHAKSHCSLCLLPVPAELRIAHLETCEAQQAWRQRHAENAAAMAKAPHSSRIAWTVESRLAHGAMKAALDAALPLPWTWGDSHYHGDYLASRVTPEAVCRIYEVKGRFHVELHFVSTSGEAGAELAHAKRMVERVVLPAIEAHVLRDSEPLH